MSTENTNQKVAAKPNPFAPAQRAKRRLRLAVTGPTGSGKTLTALRLATGLGGKTCVIDTEHDSASLYDDKAVFDVASISDYSVKNFIALIRAAEEAGYDNLIIDSFSHAWKGTGGVLEAVEGSGIKNSFAAWKYGDRIQNNLVDAILSSPMNVIVTMRSKMAYAEEVDGNNRKGYKKVGLEPIQRNDTEYEFDFVLDMQQASGTITKSRATDFDGQTYVHPGEDLGVALKTWLTTGVEKKTEVRLNETDLEEEFAKATTEIELREISEKIKPSVAHLDSVVKKQLFLNALARVREKPEGKS